MWVAQAGTDGADPQKWTLRRPCRPDSLFTDCGDGHDNIQQEFDDLRHSPGRGKAQRRFLAELADALLRIRPGGQRQTNLRGIFTPHSKVKCCTAAVTFHVCTTVMSPGDRFLRSGNYPVDSSPAIAVYHRPVMTQLLSEPRSQFLAHAVKDQLDFT